MLKIAQTTILRPVFAACWLVLCSLGALALPPPMLVPEPVSSPATLLRGNGPEPDSLDPQRAQVLSAQSVLRDLFEGLTREGPTGTIELALAESYQRSEDGLRWVFTLKAQLKFSDGSPIEAEDFVFSFNRALDPATAAPYANQLAVISGGEQRLNGSGKPLGVQALDARRLEITLAAPVANLPARLSLPIAAVLKRENLAQYRERFTRAGNLISSGAYRLVLWQPLSRIRLERNPHYFQFEHVQIPAVEFRVTEDASAEARQFEAQELHLTETVPPGRAEQLRARFGQQLRVANSTGSFFLGFNLRTGPTRAELGARSLALRQALSLSIDRRKITEIITGMGERAAYGLLPDQLGVPVQAATEFQSGLARAKQLYAQAGYTQESPLEIELRYNTSLLNRKLMLAVSVMWEQHLGVKTTLRQEEWKVFVQNRRARRITQVFRYGWNADLADPLDFLELFASDSPLNVTGYQSSEFDRGLAQLRQVSDPVLAGRLASALETELLKQQPILPLFQYTSKHLVANRLGGFYNSPLDHHPTRLMYWKSP